MRIGSTKVEVTVNFAVVGLTESALFDLRGVIEEGMAALIDRQRNASAQAQKDIIRRREVGEEFLNNLEVVEKAMARVNNQPTPTEGS